MGLLVDANGPRVATLGGALALAVGYYPIHLGLSTFHPPSLILFSVLFPLK
jgi:hypothetical protein